MSAVRIAMLAIGYFYDFTESDSGLEFEEVSDESSSGSPSDSSGEPSKNRKLNTEDEMDVFSYFPEVNVSVGSQYQGVGLRWRF